MEKKENLCSTKDNWRPLFIYNNDLCKLFRDWAMGTNSEINALMSAARGGHNEPLKLLLEWGTGANATALELALVSATNCGHLKVMQSINLEWGAKISKHVFFDKIEMFLKLPIYLFPQLLQENLNEEIREIMKKRQKEERENFIQ